ncbi:MAG: hypothetical protein HEQ32_00090 [Vampirovibrio sp.]
MTTLNHSFPLVQRLFTNPSPNPKNTDAPANEGTRPSKGSAHQLEKEGQQLSQQTVQQLQNLTPAVQANNQSLLASNGSMEEQLTQLQQMFQGGGNEASSTGLTASGSNEGPPIVPFQSTSSTVLSTVPFSNGFSPVLSTVPFSNGNTSIFQGDKIDFKFGGGTLPTYNLEDARAALKTAGGGLTKTVKDKNKVVKSDIEVGGELASSALESMGEGNGSYAKVAILGAKAIPPLIAAYTALASGTFTFGIGAAAAIPLFKTASAFIKQSKEAKRNGEEKIKNANEKGSQADELNAQTQINMNALSLNSAGIGTLYNGLNPIIDQQKNATALLGQINPAEINFNDPNARQGFLLGYGDIRQQMLNNQTQANAILGNASTQLGGVEGAGKAIASIQGAWEPNSQLSQFHEEAFKKAQEGDAQMTKQPNPNNPFGFNAPVAQATASSQSNDWNTSSPTPNPSSPALNMSAPTLTPNVA